MSKVDLSLKESPYDDQRHVYHVYGAVASSIAWQELGGGAGWAGLPKTNTGWYGLERLVEGELLLLPRTIVLVTYFDV
jgi:hypothetical protein